jgi:hypothetical protein
MIQFAETTVLGAGVHARPNALLDRIRGEYLEMPGLRLTIPQALRLWGLPPDVCEYALARLVEDGFLRQTVDGRFVRHNGCSV